MSRRRPRRRTRRGNRAVPLAIVVAGAVVAAILGVVLLGALTAYAVVSSWLEDLPDYESPEVFDVAQATRIYSADGKLLAKLYLENRTVVPISAISTDLADAIVAVEDERFYEHDGVDYMGIARAAVTNFTTGTTVEGASTITQQYVDNTILRDERTDRTLKYKVREAFLATKLEEYKLEEFDGDRIEAKRSILELYLNTVYLGEGAYGAQAAAKTFFSKNADQLTLPESALLAGLAQAPSRLNPFANPDGAVERRAHVLDRMLAKGAITQAEHDEATDAPLELKRSKDPEQGIYRAHYFVAHVKKLLQQEYSQALVFQGGLTIYTTLDTGLQADAEKVTKNHLGSRGDPDCALVAIDPRDGAIKAMVGGENYSKNKFNLATQGRRQPGSSFKTFVLVTALEDGMPPHRYVDSSSPAVIPSNPPWIVSNSEGRGRGMITMESATRSSVNTVFARLIWDLNTDEASGAERVGETAHRMGISSDMPPYPSIALGSQNVTPLEMASAYGTLATNGVHYPAMAITKVVGPDGDVVFEAEPDGERVLEPEIAYAATSILKGVISGGTGRRANIGRPAAGKTGTSQNYRDAWFVGYTPQLVTSVWVGYYETETAMRNVHGARGFGGTLAAPIWADFMKRALAGEPVLDFEKQDKPEYKWRDEWVPKIAVPKLVGLSLGEAEKLVSESGFKLSVKKVYDEAKEGTVIGQDPKAGSKVSQGTTLTLKVSKGPKAPPPAPPPAPEPEPEPTSTPSP
ncbi:MAG: PBP1A family penicillin-binding protein [Coriobacteriia bacterium]|nr:PBP1A family penicillin-binding protein [Coriobacteriia bacterium]